MSMAICSCLKNLIGEFLNCLWRQWSSDLPHVFLQVVFAVFENEIQVILLINHFLELDNIWVFDTFEQGDLTDGCTWNTIIFLFKFDFLESYYLSSLGIFSLIYNTISSLTEFVKLMVFVEITFCGLHFS